MELRQTGRAVTPFEGLAVFVEILRGVGFAEQVRGAMRFELKVPNAIPAVETYGGLCGFNDGRSKAGLLKAEQAF